MSVPGVWAECLSFHPQKSVVVENSGGRRSSDAGLLLVREFDQRVKLTEQFAAAMSDLRRDPENSLLSMVRQRIDGIIAGHVEWLTANGSEKISTIMTRCTMTRSSNWSVIGSPMMRA